MRIERYRRIKRNRIKELSRLTYADDYEGRDIKKRIRKEIKALEELDDEIYDD